MNGMVQRLQKIATECEDPQKKKDKEDAEKKMDDFQKLKNSIAKDIKTVREHIEDRNKLLKGAKGERNEKAVRLSQDIRNELKEVKKKATELDNLHKQQLEKMEKQKLKAKNKVTQEVEDEIKNRGQIVELTFRHLEELKYLEKQGYKGGRASEIDSRLTDTNSAPAKLPDIDDPQFEILRNNDALINAKLDVVLDNVMVLKNIANEMNNELDKQTEMIDNLNTKAEKVQDQMENLNVRLKKQLNNVRSCDRFIIDFICVILILALALYLYNVIK